VKRPIIVLLVIIGIIAVCVHARHRVGAAREKLHAYAGVVFSHIEEEDAQAAQSAVEALSNYWRKEQRYLILFLRHAELDEVSRSVARLKSHAEFEEWADLHSELRAILWQIDHIWQSERIRIGTFLLSA